MTDLPSLIVRVERLEGPDREVDLEIARALVPDVIVLRLRRDPLTAGRSSDTEEHTFWEYTASLDAVVALAERVLPALAPAIGMNVHHRYWHGRLSFVRADGDVDGYSADAPTPALAPLLALLRAVQAQQNKETT